MQEGRKICTFEFQPHAHSDNLFMPDSFEYWTSVHVSTLSVLSVCVCVCIYARVCGVTLKLMSDIFHFIEHRVVHNQQRRLQTQIYSTIQYIQQMLAVSLSHTRTSHRCHERCKVFKMMLEFSNLLNRKRKILCVCVFVLRKLSSLKSVTLYFYKPLLHCNKHYLL